MDDKPKRVKAFMKKVNTGNLKPTRVEKKEIHGEVVEVKIYELTTKDYDVNLVKINNRSNINRLLSGELWALLKNLTMF